MGRVVWRIPAAGVCVEPFPTHSYDGGLFQARRCLLVDRALTGSLDGRTVEMDGDGTHADQLQSVAWVSLDELVTQEKSVGMKGEKVS